MAISPGWEVFVRDVEELREGKEIEILIRDRNTYSNRKVKAIASSSKKPGAEPLWVRSLVGHLLFEKPWSIKIIKELK